MNQAEKIAVYEKNRRQLEAQEEIVARLYLGWGYNLDFSIQRPEWFSDARWFNFLKVTKREYLERFSPSEPKPVSSPSNHSGSISNQ